MKRGFTLIETVVTVGIVAAMAAVVIPQVARQFDTADPTRIQNDLKNIQAAVETFNVNVKQLPGDLDDLANQIGANDSTLIGTDVTATMPAFTATALWKGPYVDVAVVDNVAATDTYITTGYEAQIKDTFVCYAGTNNQHGVSEGTATGTPNGTCPTGSTGQKFLAFQITGVPCVTTAGSTFMTINALFDGAAETGAGAATAGRIRCVVASTAPTTQTDVDVVFFLAVPIT